MSKKIETIEDATKIINNVSGSFIGLAIIQIVLLVVLLQNYYAIIDSLIIIVIALLLRKFKNIVSSILILLVSLGALVATVMSKIGLAQGGQNVYLTVLMVYMSIKAVKATLFIRKAKKEEINI
ncbi:hypothetical protein [Tepidibacter hydrothermalis]|uniref:Uncharacterized protein n=1 Tax=Tepidibacter hydrothermalis TaxID=3036126 RepID=A0ABY8EDB3_9FIRM|nr:hypothetical protein [Tepidibacter hydrothermalis]WFD10926.1 hypothetical protein P4S50_02305 [Tepidibacter hydrothermalis]